MGGLRDIKRRISSVKSTQKITRAMKMVAAAKLRRSQDAILRARPYAHHLRALVNSLVLRTDPAGHALLRQETSGRIVLIVVTSDRGLCGSYNSSVINAAIRATQERFAGQDLDVVVIGRKGVDILRRRNVNVIRTYTGIMDGNVMRATQEVLDEIVSDFIQGNVGGIYCLYNEFKSALVQNVVLEQLLPFESAPRGDEIVIDYLYEPSDNAVLEQLLMHSLYIQMHRILYEAAASEHGARMTAMESATKNAGDMIHRLTLQYNRVRQDAITKEMIEIIGGAEAL
jgi:F-type H+-transporting ATPase subunit gamma